MGSQCYTGYTPNVFPATGLKSGKNFYFFRTYLVVTHCTISLKVLNLHSAIFLKGFNFITPVTLMQQFFTALFLICRPLWHVSTKEMLLVGCWIQLTKYITLDTYMRMFLLDPLTSQHIFMHEEK